MVSGLAYTPRHASAFLPTESSVEISPGGLLILRNTCANTIQRRRTEGRHVMAGRAIGDATGGADLEAASDISDANRAGKSRLSAG